MGQDPVILNLNIGTGLKNLGRAAEAKPYLRKCLQLQPDYDRCKERLREIEQMERH